MQVSSDKRQVAPLVRGKHARLMLEDALLGTVEPGRCEPIVPSFELQTRLADVVKVRIGSQAPLPLPSQLLRYSPP